MKTNSLQFNDRELPGYLGYGIPDRNSIHFEKDVLKANYVFECDGSLVHQVTWEKDRCCLETFCHGINVRMTTYPTLKKALLADCRSWTPAEDDCFLFLSNEVSRVGNIYVNHPKAGKKELSVCYYPAGKLFLYSLPMVTRTPAYNYFLEQVKESPALRFFRERKGFLLLEDPDLSVNIHPVVIADFIVPLAHMVSAAKTIAEAGIINKEKYLCLMVNESYASEQTLMQVFTGNEAYPYFGICFKEFGQEKYEALKDMFRLQVEGLSSRHIKNQIDP